MIHDDLEWLLRARLPESGLRNLADWLASWRCLAAQHEAPVTLALRGGFAADRLGWAFAAGYQAAMRAAFPGGGMIEAFCATEVSGQRPRDLTTAFVRTASGLVLNGAKSWSTFGSACDHLLVVARDPEAEASAGRPVLRIIRVPATAPGVTFTAQPPLPFITEVPHTAVTFTDATLPASALLEGDGYDRYLKPFRTVEDIHVTLAMLAHALRETRRVSGAGDDAALLAELGACMVAAASLASASPSAPSTHLLLEAVQQQAGALYGRVGERLKACADDAALRWQRDTRIFRVAHKARAMRASKAREMLGLQGAVPGQAAE